MDGQKYLINGIVDNGTSTFLILSCTYPAFIPIFENIVFFFLFFFFDFCVSNYQTHPRHFFVCCFGLSKEIISICNIFYSQIKYQSVTLHMINVIFHVCSFNEILYSGKFSNIYKIISAQAEAPVEYFVRIWEIPIERIKNVRKTS